ncbi:Retroviral aspartyl protease [Corchorus olitorius]|uniref:Retroviral aspartyl protease n=1 Tax=Corchorus olitorius TaxID=93759 RepID=A0A1R3KRU9_9ROSI|nr:Retroviral aspartyl protease [Corchorus olitorius]
MIKAKLNAQKTIRRAPPALVYGGFPKSNQNTTTTYQIPTVPAIPRLPTLPAPQVKRLTPAEMQAWRAKGLCYNCDEKYTPGHRCRTIPFLLLQSEDEENSGELLAIEANPGIEPPPLSSLPLPPPPQNYIPPDSEDFQVSYYALHGHSPHRCLRLKAKIAGHLFTVLVDSGSTHNLIQPRVAHFLNLPVQPAPPLTIEVGNGETLKCSGRISDLNIELQQHQFTLDLFLLDIHGAEVVLGIQWLSQLGPIVMDFSGLTMTFLHGSELVTLSGIGPPHVSALTLAQFRRLTQTNGIESAHLLAMAEAAQETRVNARGHRLNGTRIL